MPVLVGICGGSASGKTSVAKKIVEEFDGKYVITLSLDSFYRDLTSEEMQNISNFNFDHPDAFDFEGLQTTLSKLKNGEKAQVPLYDFTTSSRTGYKEIGECPPDVIIVEGILIFSRPELRSIFDLKIFVHEDEDTRLIRRLRRDTTSRGRTLESVLVAWEKFVKPAFVDFIEPGKRHADLILPQGAENSIGIGLLVEHVKLQVHDSPKKET